MDIKNAVIASKKSWTLSATLAVRKKSRRVTSKRWKFDAVSRRNSTAPGFNRWCRHAPQSSWGTHSARLYSTRAEPVTLPSLHATKTRPEHHCKT